MDDYDELKTLRQVIFNIYNELTDPMGFSWCDRPEDDRTLLEDLVQYIRDETGIGNEPNQ